MTRRDANRHRAEAVTVTPLPPTYPFTAIVGQEEMKLALLLNVVAPSIGGVLIMGHRGTGKTTAVRSLADLLPPITKVRGCVYGCDPSDANALCADCAARLHVEARLPRERAPVRVVELPLGATEDRVCGTLDLERALTGGVKAFEPGLLARANRGFLYIDEVNLLEDHLVDVLLDVAASGRNRVEREGVSAGHPARFVLVGSGNPEEGELRPQLVDRFGLCADVRTAADIDERVAIIERREAFERDAAAFLQTAEQAQTALRRRLQRAQRTVQTVEVPRALLRLMAELCQRLRIDGHRGELTLTRAARALAALEGRREATASDLRRVAAMSLRHRMRRDPLEHASGEARIADALDQTLAGASSSADRENPRHQPASNFSPEHDGNGAGGQHQSAPRNEQSDAATDARHQRPRRRPTPNSEESGDPHNLRGAEHTLPPIEMRLASSAPVATPPPPRIAVQRASQISSTRRRREAHSQTDAPRGRYARATHIKRDGATIALDATLRAAAPLRNLRREHAPARHVFVTAEDLRYKRLSRREGALFIFAVDASGSMAANRIGQAKGALGQLLRRSYINRDRIALVSFREREARVLVAPCRAPARAKQTLDALAVGGATPIAAGLLCALEVAQRAARRGTRRIMLYIFTDGRANVALGEDETADRITRRSLLKVELAQLGAALQHAGVVSTVIDTQNRFTARGEGQTLAAALGGRLVQLPVMVSETAVAAALAIS